MKTANQFVALTVLLVSAAAGTAQTVPALINYQGRLANPDGTALPTSDYTLTFSVYASPTNQSTAPTNLIWGPQIFDGVNGQGHGGKIPVVQGYFNVMLGPVDTNGVSLDTAFNATNRYVEIRVGTNNPILPRQQILSAPYALNSAKLAGADWSAVFGTNDPVNGRIPNAKIGIGSVTLTNLAVRQIGTNVGVGGLAVSPSGGNIVFPPASGNPANDTAVSNLTVTLATTGLRPVMVMIIPDPIVDSIYPDGSFIGTPGIDNYNQIYVTLYRGTNRVSRVINGPSPASAGRNYSSPGGFSFVDLNPPQGTNTYSIYAAGVTGNVIHFRYVRLLAYEL